MAPSLWSGIMLKTYLYRAVKKLLAHKQVLGMQNMIETYVTLWYLYV